MKAIERNNTKMIKDYLKQNIPAPVLSAIRSIRRVPKELDLRLKIKKAQANHKKALGKIKGKQKIKVAFFLIHESVWKWDGVYRLMENDEQFDPVIIVCPYITYGETTMLREMNSAYDSFKKNRYNVLKSLDERTGEWIDVKKTIKPDFIFFTNPYNLTLNQYTILNYIDCLTVYTPYSYSVANYYQNHYNTCLHNVIWKYYLESDIHKDLACKYSTNGGYNVIVAGYPGIDHFFRKNRSNYEHLKYKKNKKKIIIWAPHHTIEGYGSTLDYSTFLQHFDTMQKVAKKYENDVHFVFKPHPILRSKLSLDEVWGKEKTDAYYARWENMANGEIVDGNYVDLFFESDGMIHDSGSFVVEYLCTEKPSMFLLRDDKVFDRFNEVGRMALECHYHGKNVDDITYFIDNIILKKRDQLLFKRKQFVESVLLPPNGISASENIYKNLLKSLGSL